MAITYLPCYIVLSALMGAAVPVLALGVVCMVVLAFIGKAMVWVSE